MPGPPQTNCPKCGQLNSYDPRFVVRPIQCTACGQMFTPGYAPLQGSNVAPSPLPLRANGKAIASLVLGILSCISLIPVFTRALGVSQIAPGALPIGALP